MGLFKRDDDGARTLVYAGGSRTILAFVDAAKRRKRALGIATVVLLIVSTMVFFGVTRYLQAQAAARVVQGYGALTNCLLGAPLEKGQVASVRVRAMQLTACTQSDMKRGKKDAEPWPDRCARYAHMLNEGLVKSAIGSDKGKALVDSSRALAELLSKKDMFHTDLSPQVDRVFADAVAAGIVVTKADGPGPPEPAKAYTIDALTGAITTKPMALDKIHVERHPSSTVRFVAGNRVCSIAADKAKCSDLPTDVAAAKGGARLRGTTEDNAAPLVFAGDGSGGIFRMSGDRLGEGVTVGAYSAVDGYAAALVADGDRLQLIEGADKPRTSNVSPPGRVKLASATRDATLLWSHAVYLGTEGDDLVLAAAPVDPKGRGLGRGETIGVLAGAKLGGTRGRSASPRLHGCQSKATVVLARTGRDDFLSFWLGNRWSKPLKVASPGGTLGCHGTEATLTRYDSRGDSSLSAHITHTRCTPTECSSNTVKVRGLLLGEQGLAPAGAMLSAALNGKLLVAWKASQRGGVRIRVGDATKISSVPDVIVYDDLVEKGQVLTSSTLLDMRLLTADGFAVLLLNTSVGVRALRITVDGKATPVEL